MPWITVTLIMHQIRMFAKAPCQLLQSLVTAWRGQEASCPAHCRDQWVKPKVWVCNDPAWFLTTAVRSLLPESLLLAQSGQKQGRNRMMASPQFYTLSSAAAMLSCEKTKLSFGHFISTITNRRYFQGFVNMEITVWTLVWLSVFISRF